MNFRSGFFPFLSLICLLGVLGCKSPASDVASDSQAPENTRIEPSDAYPQYWSFQGQPTLLLGGSVEDNLFQVEALTEQLDLLASVGGNYVRNTMSSRDSGNVWAFQMQENGKYNLNEWNEAYWNRFEKLLAETARRNIIVQIEVWATFDFYRENWDKNPFNPLNNKNYSVERSALPTQVPTHPTYAENDFFRSVPTQIANAIVLGHQQRFVDKLLSHSLKYDHVLYCMDNETSVNADWGRFWATYIRKVGAEEGKEVQTTEMWDPWDLAHAFHRETFDHPETYTFVDISQNNHQTGENHWNNGLAQIERLQKIDALRPLNNVKIYGNDGGRHKTTQDAIESFCRSVLFGAASARFHRPTSGQGLNETAQAVIQSMRTLTEKIAFFSGTPQNELLTERSENEAYCRANPGTDYLVYFPAGGAVQLDVSAVKGPISLRWMNILTAEWETPIQMEESDSINLTCKDDGHWAVIVSPDAAD